MIDAPSDTKIAVDSEIARMHEFAAEVAFRIDTFRATFDAQNLHPWYFLDAQDALFIIERAANDLRRHVMGPAVAQYLRKPDPGPITQD